MIGGGPAGTTAAAALARKGRSVILLEAGSHPRPRVGESLLPGIIPILDGIGALDAIEAHGFGIKTGTTHLRWGATPSWDLWFRDTDAYDHAWFVDRSAFDEILWKNAIARGVDARDHSVVKELLWEGERLVGARYQPRGGEMKIVHATHVIDASGLAGLVTRAKGHRTPMEGLQHRAAWAHWEGAGRMPEPRRAQGLFIAEASHWTWYFPLSETRTSIGVIMLDRPDGTFDYEAVIRSTPEIERMLATANRVTPVRFERDWSYRAEPNAGLGYRVIGDAAGFIDPVLSTGVFLALEAAWRAAKSILDVQLDGRDEENASAEYSRAQSELFRDLVRMVRFYYQQTLTNEDYFWESKRILVSRDNKLRPQRAFLILTSGLVGNLAFEQATERAETRRTERTQSSGADPDSSDDLSFVCISLKHAGNDLYFLLEEKDPGVPALARTKNFDVNCLAPKYGNDVLHYPELAPQVRKLVDRVNELERPKETLAEFWRRASADLGHTFAALPPTFEVVRIFGE